VSFSSRRGAPQSAGRATSKTLPIPSALRTETRPRCQLPPRGRGESEAEALGAAGTTPADEPREDALALGFRNPGPSSETVKSASPARSVTPSRTGDPGGENFKAFPTTLSTTRRGGLHPEDGDTLPGLHRDAPGAAAPIASARRAARPPRSTTRAVVSKSARRIRSTAFRDSIISRGVPSPLRPSRRRAPARRRRGRTPTAAASGPGPQ